MFYPFIAFIGIIFNVLRNGYLPYFYLIYSLLFSPPQLRDWLHDKMAAAQDETYRDAKNLHSKYVRHQAFEAEISANKERLNKVVDVSFGRDDDN